MSFKPKILVLGLALCNCSATQADILPLAISKKLADIVKKAGNAEITRQVDRQLAKVDSSWQFGTEEASKTNQLLWQEACLVMGCDKNIPIRRLNLDNSKYLWITRADAVYINEAAYEHLSFGAKFLALHELAILTKYHEHALIHLAQLVILPVVGIAGYFGLKKLIQNVPMQIIGAGTIALTLAKGLEHCLQAKHDPLLLDAAKSLGCYRCLLETGRKDLKSIVEDLKKSVEDKICTYHSTNN